MNGKPHIKNFSIFNRRKSKWLNDGFRSLYESVIPSEVLTTLNDWKLNYNGDNYVLIGGLCMSYYLKPRYTEDVDLIFISESEVPKNVYKFRKNRPHSFEHIKTGVEVEIITPNHIDSNSDFFKVIFDNSIISDGIRIASPESLIALKLGRFNDTDQLDIKNLYRYCMQNNISINLEKYNLSEKDMVKFNSLDIDDSHYENHQMLEVKNYFNKPYENIKIGEYEIYIFENNYGEPKFYFSKNLKSKIKRFTDFKFGISLSKTFENDKLRVVESSTDYKSFNSFRKEESILIDFLNSDNNLNRLVNIWNKLNPKRKIN